MTERQMQFRVGLFVIAATIACGVMVFHFGQLSELLEPQYPLILHFDAAPGVHAGTPVRRNGISIGKVEDVVFDKYEGGVMVLVRINSDVRLRQDASPGLERSLLGDATIEFTPGASPRFMEAGTKIEGVAPMDPMKIVENLERNVSKTLETFNTTGAEWNKVAQNLNNLMDTNQGNLQEVLAKTVGSLNEFTQTMTIAQKTLGHADTVLGNPAMQQSLQQTVQGLPQMLTETRQVIQAVRLAVVKADQNLANLNGVTKPLAQRSTSIVTRLDSTVANLDAISGQLRDFMELAVKEDGSIQQFVANPALYQNMNNSAASLSVLLRNLEPVLKDVRIFSDKIARHPELIGVSGALNPSSGVKEASGTTGEYRQTTRPNTRFSRN